MCKGNERSRVCALLQTESIALSAYLTFNLIIFAKMIKLNFKMIKLNLDLLTQTSHNTPADT